jgi:murein DD-endopeptidase MepM/ murein hydrolase activator NlpD
MTLRSNPADGGHDWRWRLLVGVLAVLSIAATFGIVSRGTGATPVDGNRGLVGSSAHREAAAQVSAEEPPATSDAGIEAAATWWTGAPNIRLRYSHTLSATAWTDAPEAEQKAAQAPAPVLRQRTITVRRGDSLYTIFKAEGLRSQDLATIMATGKPTAALARLRPEDRITVYTDAKNQVQGLTHERPGGKTLNVARDGGIFRAGGHARPANAVLVAADSDNSVVDNGIADNSVDWVEWHKPPPTFKRHSVSVSNGDSLYSIFKSNGFALADLATIVAAGDETRQLARLVPGQRLDFHLTADNGVARLVHYLDDTRSLHIRRNGVGYDSKLVDVPLDRHTATAAGTIDASLFVAGQRAGLSSKIIMQMVEIFGWDVDFALDIRAGDRFAVVYEKLYKNGEKLKDGNILVAMFTNQGRTTRIVRYDYPDGRNAYFTPEGVSIRKAFLRSPVSYSRITSRFSSRRKHPKLNKFRAHRGVDYAAARGTPIKAAGDAKVEFIGYKGGYGKAVILRHGAMYTTLYAHMSRFARGLRRGQRVSQGQTIGYIGSTGLATGPHLHYEFRVRNVHRNPLNVKLPRAAPIEKKYAQDFLVSTRDLVARLDVVTNPTLAANEQPLGNTE